MSTRAFVLALPILGALACGGRETPAASGAGHVTAERLQRDDEPGQWLALGRGWRADRFSPLTRISAANVDSLGLAWEYEYHTRRGRVEHGQESTPIVVDGVVYFAGPWGGVVAVDGATGQEKWRYDPDVDANYGRRACCGVVNRGALVWQGKVYVGTLDGFLVALDAGTGRVLWKVDTFTDRTHFYTITSPPMIAGTKVVIGNSGAEFGVRGYVTAFDAATGTLAWRFYTVPGDPAKGFEHPELAEAAKTWDPRSDWASGLGGSVWGEMTYDPQLDLLYVGTGNSSPYPIWYRSPSGGDNLYLVSILAIRPDSGRLAWHYQETPSEIWDYTATANMVLADLDIGGTKRQVIMQAPKNGFFYVLDRKTGQFISGKPFVHVNWASGIDSVTGRPVLNPEANYHDGPKLIFPTQAGGHNWPPMAYSPATGLVYLTALEEGMVMFSESEYRWTPGQANMGAGGALGVIPPAIPGATPAQMAALRASAKRHPDPSPQSVLVAWDPVRQEARWRRPLGKVEIEGGVMTTAGNLVIHGTTDGRLLAWTADSGKLVKEWTIGTGILAAPSTYEVNGTQYVAVLAGYGGALEPAYPPTTAPTKYRNYGRLLSFKLGGGAVKLPEALPNDSTPEPPALPALAKAKVAHGQELFMRYCVFCHSGRGNAQRSAYPDLHRIPAATHAKFEDIVLRGALSTSGMANFSDVLSEQDARDVHAFVVQEQRKLRAEERGKK